MPSYHDASLNDATDEQLVAEFPNNEYAFQVLMLRYVRLIYHIANAMAAIPQDAEDYAEEGLLGLFDAALSYSPERNAAFRTYAVVCIRNRMRNAQIKMMREHRDGAEEPHLSFDMMEESGAETICDPQGTPETIYLQKERMTALYQEMARVLSKLEMEIFSLYVSELSYAAIAERLGISVKSVDNAIRRARRKLRDVRSLPSAAEDSVGGTE